MPTRVIAALALAAAFAAFFAYWVFPEARYFSGAAAAWLIAAGPVVGLSLHGLVLAVARARAR